MDSAYPLYAADNTLDEYYAMAPNLTGLQIELINAYYRARRETESSSRIKFSELERQTELIPLDSDLSIHVLQKLDDEFILLEQAKLKRLNNGR
jgi:hypothetical protein